MTGIGDARIGYLEDQLQLQKLINTYHWRADQLDWQGWSETFTEDAVFDLPNAFGLLKGRKQIHDICKGNMAHVYKAMQHIMVNLDFEITGADSASGRANLIFSGIADPAKPTEYVQSGGRYQWEFRRTRDGWRIAKAHLIFLWSNGGDKESVLTPRK